jgi:hypothetical protein
MIADGSTAATHRSVGSYDPEPAPTFSTVRASAKAAWMWSAIRGSAARASSALRCGRRRSLQPGSCDSLRPYGGEAAPHGSGLTGRPW